jgi:hypothetical protein
MLLRPTVEIMIMFRYRYRPVTFAALPCHRYRPLRTVHHRYRTLPTVTDRILPLLALH